MIRPLVMMAIAALAALPAQAQKDKNKNRDDDFARDADQQESRLDTTVALDRNGTVELSLTSGEIRVTGWDRREARVRAYSERGTLRFDATGSRIELGVRSRSGRTGETRYELSVPVGTRVLMRSVSGDLIVQGVKGEVEANSVSGDLTMTDAADRVSFESVSGSVVARGVAGVLRGNTVSGDLQLERVQGDVEVQTVSGEIALRDVRAKFVRARSTSGEVEFSGPIDPAGRYDFGSHSGDIRLTLPASTDATMSVETFSGDIDSAFPVQLAPGTRTGGRPRSLDFTIGKGGARLSAETFSGNIEIHRGESRSER